MQFPDEDAEAPFDELKRIEPTKAIEPASITYLFFLPLSLLLRMRSQNPNEHHILSRRIVYRLVQALSFVWLLTQPKTHPRLVQD